MRALLDKLLISFTSDDSRLLAGWSKLFDLEIAAATTLPPGAAPDIELSATVTEHLPLLTAEHPTYSESRRGTIRARVQYYETARGGTLVLARPAQIQFDFAKASANIYLKPQILDSGNLEDITMIALEPFLRFEGFFMVHAFAVAGEKAVLLCGKSGSGKTTSGLALLQAGWRYLANDLILLRQEQEHIVAYPSPGTINLTPASLDILPDYRTRLSQPTEREGSGKYVLSRISLLTGAETAQPTAVGAIFFLKITGQQSLSYEKVHPAIGLARLTADSADRWHAETYEKHLDRLAHLSLHVPVYDLFLPRNQVDGLDQFIRHLSAA